jgi:hypothetical protein
VTAISPRGMPTFTTLGNQLVDLAAYDESTSMAKSIYTG